jgi:hypothetical protein
MFLESTTAPPPRKRRVAEGGPLPPRQCGSGRPAGLRARQRLKNCILFVSKPPREGLQPSNENIQHFKPFLHFFQLWVIFALLDTNPDPVDQNQCGSIRIRIHNTGVFSSGPIRFPNRIHTYVKVGRDEGELREEGSGPPEGQDAEHPAAQHCRHTRILLSYHIATYISSRRAKVNKRWR